MLSALLAKYLLPGLGVVIGILLLALTVSQVRLHYAQGKVEKVKSELAQKKTEIQGWATAVATLEGALKGNREAIAECEQINLDNARDAALLEEVLDSVEADGVMRERTAAERVADLHREAEERRGTDQTCRTLDEPLPEWLANRVRNPGN